MVKINCIGDIHGRTTWQNLIIEDGVNVFLGDYFDPYDDISEWELKNNFLNIVEFKYARPETILLLGNHDLHYIYDNFEKCSRYNKELIKEWKQLFDEYKEYFQLAYCTNDALITHAGVTNFWYKTAFPNCNKESKEIVNNINSLNNEKDCYKLSFSYGVRNIADCYGDDISHSPVWIRPYSLLGDLIPIKQIVGHTQVKDIVELDNLIIVDCLGNTNKSYIYESN